MATENTKALSSQVILLANIIDRVPHDISLVPLIDRKGRLPYYPIRTSTSDTRKKFTHFDCWTVPHYYEILNVPEYGTCLDFPSGFASTSSFFPDDNYLIPNYNEKGRTGTPSSESNDNANEKEVTEPSGILDPKDFDLSSQADEDRRRSKKVKRRQKSVGKRKVVLNAQKMEREVKRVLISIKKLNIDLMTSVLTRSKGMPFKEKLGFTHSESAHCNTGCGRNRHKVSEGNYCSRQEYDGLVFYIESLQVKYNILFCFTNQFEQYTKFTCDQLERFVEIKRYCVLMLLRLRAELGNDYSCVMEYIYNCNNISEIKSWADILFGINKVYDAKSRRDIVQNLLELYNVHRQS